MPQFHSEAATVAANHFKLDAFVAAYIMAAYFTDTGDSEQPSSEADLADDAITAAQDDCRAFQKLADVYLKAAYAHGMTEEGAGHDFWLTRNHHGVGFWDRTELKVPQKILDALTDYCHEMGESSLYEGDDGKLYFGPG